MAIERVYEVQLRWANLYAQPSTFSAVQRRLGRSRRLVGHVVRNSWVQCAGGGYVRLTAVRDLGVADVNEIAWTAYLDTLPADERERAQHIMARIQFVINSDRNRTLDDVQRLERKVDVLQREIVALNTRLDEQARERAVGE